MTLLAPDPTVRTAIDSSVGAALTRLRGRARALDAAELGDAIARAAAGGKRFRPALVVAAAEAWGAEPAPALYEIAAAFELLHTAFVVHDDVIDHDTVRRGVPNVGGEFRQRARERGADAAGAALLGDAAGILAGDLLLHEAERLITLVDLPAGIRTALADLVDDAVLVTVVGELRDVENAVAVDLPEAEATLATAHDKTAVYSFRAPLQAGALLGGATGAELDIIGRIGGRLGLAFQLVDDLIGAFGTEVEAGRASGSDLREAKRTPLIALARRSTGWERVDSALSLAHTGPIAVREAQHALDDSGARAELREIVGSILDSAAADAASAPLPSAAADLLVDLADTIRGRMT